jgi:hypothetical protein
MTSQGNGQPRTYKVSMSEQNRDLVKQKQREATQAGNGEQFLAAWRIIVERLRTDPLSFGDLLYHLPALKLLVYRAVVASVVVEYAVHDEKPVVFIRVFKVLS